MTPEEILRGLRDIHLPDRTADSAAGGFVAWPLLLVLVTALLAAWIAWRRRSAWRRDIIRHLDLIEGQAGAGRTREAWTALATLLRRIAVSLCAREEVAGLVEEAWLAKLDQLFGTDAFSRGPGRGVLTFPYQAPLDDDQDTCARSADQLRAAVADIRAHLPRLAAAR